VSHSTLISILVPIQGNIHACLVSIMYIPSDKSVHLWIIPWLPPLLLLWCHCSLITLILSYLAVHRSILLVFSEHSMHLLESWHSSSLAPYHWHPQSSSNSSIGCPLNGESDSNLPSWLSRHYRPVIRHTLPTLYNIANLPSPRVYLPVTYFHFCGTTFYSFLVHFI